MASLREILVKIWLRIQQFLKFISYGKIFTGLYFRKRKFYSTMVGGILTVIVFLFITALCAITLKNVFQGQTLSSTSQIKDNYDINGKTLYDFLDQTEFTFVVNIYDRNVTCDDFKNNVIFERYNRSIQKDPYFTQPLDLECWVNGDGQLQFNIPKEKYKDVIVDNQTCIILFMNNTKEESISLNRMNIHYLTQNNAFSNTNLESYRFTSQHYMFGDSYGTIFEILVYNYTDNIWFFNSHYIADVYFQGKNFFQSFYLNDIMPNQTNSENELLFFFYITLDHQSVNIITVTPQNIFEALYKIGGYLSLLTLLKFFIEWYNHRQLEQSIKKDLIDIPKTNHPNQIDEESKFILTEQDLKEPLEDFQKLNEDIREKFSFENMNRLFEKLNQIDQKISVLYRHITSNREHMSGNNNNITWNQSDVQEHEKIN